MRHLIMVYVSIVFIFVLTFCETSWPILRWQLPETQKTWDNKKPPTDVREFPWATTGFHLRLDVMFLALTPTHLPTHQPTHPSTHPPTHKPTHPAKPPDPHANTRRESSEFVITRSSRPRVELRAVPVRVPMAPTGLQFLRSGDDECLLPSPNPEQTLMEF